MLPANLAKTRAAGRGAYGELLLLNPGAVAGGGTSASTASAAVRYAPYPIPVTAASLPVAAATGHGIPVIAVAPAAPLHYASALYDMTGCKRVFAAPATLRPIPRPAPALAYTMNDLLAVQSLDIPTIYANMSTGLPL